MTDAIQCSQFLSGCSQLAMGPLPAFMRFVSRLLCLFPGLPGLRQRLHSLGQCSQIVFILLQNLRFPLPTRFQPLHGSGHLGQAGLGILQTQPLLRRILQLLSQLPGLRMGPGIIGQPGQLFLHRDQFRLLIGKRPRGQPGLQRFDCFPQSGQRGFLPDGFCQLAFQRRQFTT